MKTVGNTEKHLILSGRGKWSQPRVPHRGWNCVDIEDLGEPHMTCQMCESQTIRYVHYMENPNFSEVLAVGCICAGHMEGDLASAQKRESSMQSRTGKRKRWLSRRWKISAKGNPWIKSDGYRVTIYKRGDGWAATVSSEDNKKVAHSRLNFQLEEQAKLAAFDHITRLLTSNKNN